MTKPKVFNWQATKPYQGGKPTQADKDFKKDLEKRKDWVLSAHDPDTLRVDKGDLSKAEVKSGKKSKWIRLIGYNAPERGKRYYKTGTKLLQGLIDTGQVTPNTLEWGEGERKETKRKRRWGGKYKGTARALMRARLKRTGYEKGMPTLRYASGVALEKGYGLPKTIGGNRRQQPYYKNLAQRAMRLKKGIFQPRRIQKP